jgi:hypothetical protein
MAKLTKKPTIATYKRSTYLILTSVVMVLAIGYYLGWRSLHAAKTTPATTKSNASSSSSDRQYSATGTSSGSNTAGSTSGSNSSSPTSTPAVFPAPSGQLLNVQTVSLSSGPGMESICQTLANARCDIRLTQGSTVKYVGEQTTGYNGMVIFDWSAKDVGLTIGQWSVQAVVTQNGATGVSHTEYLMVQS